jgi:hypothetical protein
LIYSAPYPSFIGILTYNESRPLFSFSLFIGCSPAVCAACSKPKNGSTQKVFRMTPNPPGGGEAGARAESPGGDGAYRVGAGQHVAEGVEGVGRGIAVFVGESRRAIRAN